MNELRFLVIFHGKLSHNNSNNNNNILTLIFILKILTFTFLFIFNQTLLILIIDLCFKSIFQLNLHILYEETLITRISFRISCI